MRGVLAFLKYDYYSPNAAVFKKRIGAVKSLILQVASRRTLLAGPDLDEQNPVLFFIRAPSTSAQRRLTHGENVNKQTASHLLRLHVHLNTARHRADYLI